jgi:sensor histidine kinase YesM
MFTQPFVENAIIHGVQHMENGEITVQYQDSGSTISVAIKDNGKGVAATSQNANSLHKSMGTSITKQRMENLLKSENYPVTLEVISKNEPHEPQGTTVMLTFLKKYL